MPNWCMNTLDITGPQDVIQEIAKTELSLKVIRPCPEELLNTASPPKDKSTSKANIKKYGHPDWYTWCVSNWGTKWDPGPIKNIEIHDLGKKGERIVAEFDSAWSPPIAAYEYLFEKYKSKGIDIRLEYIETGCRYLGVLKTENRKMVDYNLEYSSADELEKFVKEHEHGLGECEIDYVRECEQEDAETSDNPAPTIKPQKKAAKKAAKKSLKKPVSRAVKKSSKKTKKKSSSKKIAKKPLKKPLKKSLKKPLKKSSSRKTSVNSSRKSSKK